MWSAWGAIKGRNGQKRGHEGEGGPLGGVMVPKKAGRGGHATSWDPSATHLPLRPALSCHPSVTLVELRTGF